MMMNEYCPSDIVIICRWWLRSFSDMQICDCFDCC
jgi:hypothetical protein